MFKLTQKKYSVHNDMRYTQLEESRLIGMFENKLDVRKVLYGILKYIKVPEEYIYDYVYDILHGINVVLINSDGVYTNRYNPEYMFRFEIEKVSNEFNND